MPNQITPNKSETYSEISSKNSEPISTITSNDSQFLQLTVKKLNGRNFKKRTQFVKLVINGKRKMGYLTLGDNKTNRHQF